MKKLMTGGVILLTSQSALWAATIVERGVQFTEVDFAAQTLTLTNLNDTETVSLAGWRFCSHDDNQVRRYSASSGLNGISLMPGESLIVEFGAPSGSANVRTIGDIGGNFAGPFDNDAYGIQIYSAGAGFGDGTLIVDHLQWNIDGLDNTSADDRSDEADLEGNVWADQSEWIATTTDTERLVLINPDASIVEHSASSYLAVIPEPSAVALVSLSALALLRRRRR